MKSTRPDNERQSESSQDSARQSIDDSKSPRKKRPRPAKRLKLSDFKNWDVSCYVVLATIERDGRYIDRVVLLTKSGTQAVAVSDYLAQYFWCAAEDWFDGDVFESDTLAGVVVYRYSNGVDCNLCYQVYPTN